MLWVLIALLVIILIIAFNTIKVVKQSEFYIIERLGKFHKVSDVGLTVIISFVEHNSINTDSNVILSNNTLWWNIHCLLF